jgi:hypothetical protein
MRWSKLYRDVPKVVNLSTWRYFKIRAAHADWTALASPGAR